MISRILIIFIGFFVFNLSTQVKALAVILDSESESINANGLRNTMTFFDRQLERFIIITNVGKNAELRVTITDLEQKPLKAFRVPDSSDIIPYTISAINYYPSVKSGDEYKSGILLIQSSRGNLIVNMNKLDARFVVLHNDYYNGLNYDKIPVIETGRVKF
ncbi:MAG: hypothetical protein HRT47_13310 [Candidatus Caenarcaniphilales bacterium]|nr:hypothetical protein [Candidatus Caenarcaniphilales bacterium]